MDSLELLIRELEREWDIGGFFEVLRYREFDVEGYKRVEAVLSRLPRNLESFPQRLVSLTWFIPLFMSWQEAPNISEDEYAAYRGRLEKLVMDFLGMP